MARKHYTGVRAATDRRLSAALAGVLDEYERRVQDQMQMQMMAAQAEEAGGMLKMHDSLGGKALPVVMSADTLRGLLKRAEDAERDRINQELIDILRAFLQEGHAKLRVEIFERGLHLDRRSCEVRAWGDWPPADGDEQEPALGDDLRGIGARRRWA